MLHFLPFLTVRSNEANYNIVDTDYQSYTIVYTCSEKLFLKFELLWILTRERNPSPQLIDSVEQKIKAAGIDTSRLKKTKQTDCPEPTW